MQVFKPLYPSHRGTPPSCRRPRPPSHSPPSRRSLSPLADRWAMASVTSSNRVLAFSYQPSGSQFPGNGAEGRYTRPSHPALCHSPGNACRKTLTLPSANRFRWPQVMFSEMLRLSSCARLLMMVMRSSPLPIKVIQNNDAPPYTRLTMNPLAPPAYR